MYIETSVISYLTGRSTRDLIVAAHQEITREWWANGAKLFDLCISEVVLQEVSRGDADAAQQRLSAISGLAEIELTEAAIDLAERLLDAGALPADALNDALHVAICAANGIDILVSWNCKHIANVTMYGIIDQACRDAGYDPPRICTPVELWGM